MVDWSLGQLDPELAADWAVAAMGRVDWAGIVEEAELVKQLVADWVVVLGEEMLDLAEVVDWLELEAELVVDWQLQGALAAAFVVNPLPLAEELGAALQGGVEEFGLVGWWGYQVGEGHQGERFLLVVVAAASYACA